MSQSVRPLLSAATARLTAAGVESAAQDARVLLAFVSGVEMVRLPCSRRSMMIMFAGSPRWSTGGPSGCPSNI